MKNRSNYYYGENKYLGTIISFEITDFEIKLVPQKILVKYDIVIMNADATHEIGRDKGSYYVYDRPATYDSEGNELTQTDAEFTLFQTLPLEHANVMGYALLEDVFYINAFEKIIRINGYTDESEYIVNELGEITQLV